MKVNGHLTNDPKCHHYIPKFLLKKWYGSDEKIQYYECKHGKFITHRTVAKSAGYENHLYTPKIEKQNMQSIDTDAASAIERILSQGIHNLAKKDRRAMAIFIASLWLRTPREVSKSNKLGQENLKVIEKKLASNIGNVSLSSVAKELINDNPAYFGLHAAVSLMNDENILEDIMNLTWELVDFSSIPANLVLSDDPCGYVYDDFIVALPLSPKHAFLAAHKSNPNAIKKFIALGKLKMVQELNTASARRSSKYIYALDNKHADLAKKYLLWKKI